jgi:hypothetical protein
MGLFGLVSGTKKGKGKAKAVKGKVTKINKAGKSKSGTCEFC